MKPLNAKQRLFVAEYARTRNGSKAARFAGYNPDTAKQKAWTLLNDKKYSHVQAAIKSALDDTEEQRRIQWEAKTSFLMQTLTFDVGDLKDALGEWKPFDQMDPEDRRQIASIQENSYENEGGQRGRTLGMKFVNKMEAAKILGKHNGYFTPRDPVGEGAPYRAAEEALAGMFDRIRQRAEGPVPGSPNDGAAKNS